MSKVIKKYVGADISKRSICRAVDLHQKVDNMNFVLLDKNWIHNGLPFKLKSFDVVVAFNVIEHIPSKFVLKFLNELKTVTNEKGRLLISTPNRDVRIPGISPTSTSWNPEHLHEYSYEEFKNILSQSWTSVTIMGLFGPNWVMKLDKLRCWIEWVRYSYLMKIIGVIPMTGKVYKLLYYLGILFFVKKCPKVSDISSNELFYTSKEDLTRSLHLFAICSGK